MTQKEKSAYRISQGLCPRCGKENTSGKYVCDSCRDYFKEYRKLFLRYGVCPECKKNQLFGDERTCPECRARKIQSNAEWKIKNPEKAKIQHNKANDKYKAKMRAQGLCICGRKRGDARYLYCERCRLKMAERERLKKEKKDA